MHNFDNRFIILVSILCIEYEFYVYDKKWNMALSHKFWRKYRSIVAEGWSRSVSTVTKSCNLGFEGHEVLRISVYGISKPVKGFDKLGSMKRVVWFDLYNTAFSVRKS